jgi:hypothetical protein
MASSSSPATLQNIYYERVSPRTHSSRYSRCPPVHSFGVTADASQKVATARPCYICRRPTQTVLATIKTEDFLYACDGHLTDS